MEPIVVTPRFVGPPGRGQGGYLAGLLAERFDGPVQISLRAPVPFDTPLRVDVAPAATTLRVGGNTIAVAQLRLGELRPPSAVAPASAEDARARFPGTNEHHPAPDCFSCGIGPDSFRVHPGPVEANDHWATPFVPPAWTGNGDGMVRDRYLWAALDCTAAWSASEGSHLILTAVITADVHAAPRAEEAAVLVGAAGSWDGRKRRARSAIYDNAGELLASCEALFIKIEE